MSLINTITKVFNNSLNTLFINSIKTVGALIRPKNITMNW